MAAVFDLSQKVGVLQHVRAAEGVAYGGCPYGGSDCRDARVIERGCFLKTAGVGGVKTRAGASSNGW
jgi:hypothetical protein